MTDPYARSERIAIRQDSGIPEREAIKLTDRELATIKALQAELTLERQRTERTGNSVKPMPCGNPDGREYPKAQIAEAYRVLGRGE